MPYDELRLGELPGYWQLPVDVEPMTLLTSNLFGSGGLYCWSTAGAGVLNSSARLLGSTHLQVAEHGDKNSVLRQCRPSRLRFFCSMPVTSSSESADWRSIVKGTKASIQSWIPPIRPRATTQLFDAALLFAPIYIPVRGHHVEYSRGGTPLVHYLAGTQSGGELPAVTDFAALARVVPRLLAILKIWMLRCSIRGMNRKESW